MDRLRALLPAAVSSRLSASNKGRGSLCLVVEAHAWPWVALFWVLQAANRLCQISKAISLNTPLV